MFFCSGTKTDANLTNRHYHHVHSTGINNFDLTKTHHSDISDEDQMDQFYIMLLPGQHESRESVLFALLLLNDFHFSVWRPPKEFLKASAI